jgi:hypothetical protein
MNFGKTTPILRILDEAKAKEFYVDFLGFKIDWEHRFEASLPLYMQISQDDCIIHLSEHHGDCNPGGALRIETNDIGSMNRELLQKNTNTRNLGSNRHRGKRKRCSSSTRLAIV